MPQTIRSEVDRVVFAVAHGDDADGDFDWKIRRLAEACYESGYAAGHSAGSLEVLARERRKGDRTKAEARYCGKGPCSNLEGHDGPCSM